MDRNKPAFSNYVKRTALFMGGYSVLNAVAITGFLDRMSGPTRWAFAAMVAFPVAGQIWSSLALIREADEFVSALMAKRFIAAMGLTIALFSAWGFAESYANAPHAPGWLSFPLFWLLFGLISPFLNNTKR